MKTIMAIALAALLTGCGQTISQARTDQGDAGIARAEVNFTEDGKLKDATVIDGKERGSVALDVDLKAGTMHYAASDVKAFDGQRARNAAEQAIAASNDDAVKAVAPSIAGVIEQAIKLYLGGL